MSNRRKTWRRAAQAGAALVVVAAGTWAGARATQAHTAAAATEPAPAAVAELTMGDLVNEVTVKGDLRYAAARKVRLGGSGVLTWLPRIGATVARGQTLVSVDDEPVPLLYGELPMFRRLVPGTKGRDVRQLEDNLVALGYRGFTVDQTYSASTARAVRQWQKRIGRPVTGVVDVPDVVFAPGAVRVSGLEKEVGDQVGGNLGSFTRSTKEVVVEAKQSEAGWARTGEAVTIELTGGPAVPGVLTEISRRDSSTGSDSTDSSGGETETIRIAPSDQQPLAGQAPGPVKVAYVTERRSHVLIAPVAALLALAEGGYGLQVVSGRSSRIVAVQVGMFADTRAEVSGAGLGPGTEVGMPS